MYYNSKYDRSQKQQARKAKQQMKVLLGKRIKNLRKKKGITLNELADKLKVDKKYLLEFESGKINMTLDYLDKVIIQLGSTTKDFWNVKLHIK